MPVQNGQKRRWRKLVDENIARHGHHITLIANQTSPRFAYTIGLTPRLGFELIFAGGLVFSAAAIAEIVNGVAAALVRASGKRRPRAFDLGDHGRFTLGLVRDEWRTPMLGAIERYGDVEARQILPDEAHWTLDTPKASERRSAAANRAWKWEREEWPHDEAWGVMTFLDVLRGAPVTEVTRWEPGYWEMFAGDPSENDRADGRYVSLAIMTALDPSLMAAVDLEVGEGMRRAGRRGAWRPRGSRA